MASIASLVYFFVFAIASTWIAEVVRGWWLWTRKLEDDRKREEKRTLSNRGKPSTKRLSIVIPAYNEEKRLPAVLKSTLEYLVKRRDREGSSFTYEVVVVDDGSTDQTAVKVMQGLVPVDTSPNGVADLPSFFLPCLVLCCLESLFFLRHGSARRRWVRRMLSRSSRCRGTVGRARPSGRVA